jgi:hypothetical protein
MKLYIGHVIKLPERNHAYDVVIQFAENKCVFKQIADDERTKNGQNYLRYNCFNSEH